MIDAQAIADMLARQRPGNIPTTLSPTVARNPAFNPAQMVKGERTSRILSQLLGLNPNTQRPGISGNPALRQGLMQAGLSLMAAPKTPGTFMQNLANSLGYGQQVAQGAQAQQDAQAQRRAMLASLPPGMRRMAELLSPEDFSKFVMEQSKPQEGFTLTPGAARYNASGQLVADNPTSEKPSQRYEVFSNGGVYDREENRWVERPQVGPLVSVSTGQGKADDEFFAGEYASIENAAKAARTQLGDLDRLADALASDSVYTGAGGEALLKAKRIGQALGMQVDGVPETELIRSIGSQMALRLRNPSGGAGMPGALSDKDRDFLQAMTPGLGQTKAGNMMLVEVSRRIAERDMEVARLAREYKKNNGGRLDAGFFDLLDMRFGNNGGGDLFGDLQVPTEPVAGNGGSPPQAPWAR